MDKMNQKKLYVWRLAAFLASNEMKMSGEELAAHLNRNKFLTSYGTAYKGKRGTYRLIRETYKWVEEELQLPAEASKIAEAYVTPDGAPPWE
jgi:hypothetical protein